LPHSLGPRAQKAEITVYVLDYRVVAPPVAPASEMFCSS